jgi:hypothetical protein
MYRYWHVTAPDLLAWGGTSMETVPDIAIRASLQLGVRIPQRRAEKRNILNVRETLNYRSMDQRVTQAETNAGVQLSHLKPVRSGSDQITTTEYNNYWHNIKRNNIRTVVYKVRHIQRRSQVFALSITLNNATHVGLVNATRRTISE